MPVAGSEGQRAGCPHPRSRPFSSARSAPGLWEEQQARQLVSPARTGCSGPSTSWDRGSRGWPSLRSREPCETLTHASLFPDVLREARGQLAITESPSLFPSRGNRAQKAEGSCQRLRRSEGWCQDPCLTDVRFEVSSFKPKMEVERDRVFLD